MTAHRAKRVEARILRRRERREAEWRLANCDTAGRVVRCQVRSCTYFVGTIAPETAECALRLPAHPVRDPRCMKRFEGREDRSMTYEDWLARHG